jgi:1-acyl-sn-glycerol-3-phosphate acyltransferase
VLKRELQSDPCLDIIGNRAPHYFLDRGARDSTGELDAIRRLSTDMPASDVAVIFPEGTRASPKKREAALRKIATIDAARSERMSQLQHLLPPRPAGAAALLAGAPDVDVVIAWHVGFDGLDTFGGILKAISRRPDPVQFEMRRVARGDVPTGDAFTDWLDETWLQADRDVHRMLEEAR